ncbi:15434_t:CDS:1, partial [Funneliformis caledonium]
LWHLEERRSGIDLSIFDLFLPVGYGLSKPKDDIPVLLPSILTPQILLYVERSYRERK